MTVSPKNMKVRETKIAAPKKIVSNKLTYSFGK